MMSAPQKIDAIENARLAIEACPENPPKLSMLAQNTGLSSSRLSRVFRERFGMTPKELAQALRLQQFKQSLRDGHDVTQSIYAAGFGSPSRIYENTKRMIGMSPGRYRRKGQGLTICYTLLETTLGQVLIATTQQGICAVTLSTCAEQLIEKLQLEFSNAHLLRVDEGANEWIADVISRVKTLLGLNPQSTKPKHLPADLQATVFQWHVWHELMRIPCGETRSYKQIAEAIGRPTASRAVARACASNRLALIVPCHRVVRDDGSLGGYRWGIETKKQLLYLEKML
jgi:AraC family transcriptional regulator of adaptative response/methylated-DNA-[protein]-cysteine methyltransferase